MLLRKLVISVILVSIFGCATVGLKSNGLDYEVAQSSVLSDDFGSLEILDLEPAQLKFKFTNKTKMTSKILWDDSTIVDFEGSAHRVMHTGVKFISADRSQPPTVLPKGISHTDVVSMADSTTFIGNVGWMQTPFVVCRSEEDCKKYVGKKLIFLLTVENDGKKKEYTAELIVNKRNKGEKTLKKQAWGGYKEE